MKRANIVDVQTRRGGEGEGARNWMIGEEWSKRLNTWLEDE